MLNVYAYRATDPKDMYEHYKRLGSDAVHLSNMNAILFVAGQVDMVVCAWGTGAGQAGTDVKDLLSTCYHLGLTKDGHPRHPLYLKNETEPTLWQG